MIRVDRNTPLIKSEVGSGAEWIVAGEDIVETRPRARIYVVRQAKRFYLYVVSGWEITERVTAASASLIWDYLENTWPSGTRAYWIIL